MSSPDKKYGVIAFWVFAGLVLITAALMLKPFFPAILWAIVITVLTKPINDRLVSRNWNPNMAALVTTLGTIAVIGIPLSIVGAILFVQVNGFVHEVQNSAPNGQNVFDLNYIASELDKVLGPTIRQFSSSFSFTTWIGQNKEELTRSLTGPLRNAAIGIGTTIFMMVVAFLTQFFLLRDAHRLKEPVVAISPLDKERTLDIIDRLGRTINAVFVSVFLVGIAQGILAGVAYYVAGVPNALMWTIATIVLCMIPLLGAPIVYIPLSLILVSQGKTGAGIGLLIFCLVVVSNIDNLLKPWIIGARILLHPMAVFFALLGGIFFFGPVGLMAGPMILTLLLTLSEIAIELRSQSRNEPVEQK